MYRAGLRTAARPVLRNLGSVPVRSASRRFASTNAAPADRPRSWKSSAVRWGLAAGALYYYNSSSVFAEEATSQTVAAPAPFSDDDLPTVDSVLEEKRKQLQAKLQQAEPAASAPAKSSTPETQPSNRSSVADDASSAASGAGALEEEADQQGAFNPETGEINWDCPCLGGMAHGPCGEEFKTAFSCFVYSNEEPKGMDCIEKFQGMQECFRQYPEIYGAELSDEEDAVADNNAEPIPATETTPAPAAPASASAPDNTTEDYQKLREPSPSTSALLSNIGDSQPEPIPSREASDNIPAKWDDATGANDQVREREATEKKEKKEN